MLFLIGLLSILVTVSLHGVVTSVLIATLRVLGRKVYATYPQLGRALLVSVAAILLTLKHAVDIGLWAVVYSIFVKTGFGTFEDALYFSSVTYTTLGYGDVVLTGSPRILCGIEAINGMILFGWSTALLFVLVERLWLREVGSDQSSGDGPAV